MLALTSGLLCAGSVRNPVPSPVACLAAKPAARWTLLPDLQEISGLAMTGDGRLFAHNDERARIVQLDWRTGREVKAFVLGKRGVSGDFEGIAVAGPRLFLTTSDGMLYESREGRDGESMPYTVTRTGAGARCEVEGLTFEPKGRLLLFLCKTPVSAALRGRITLLRWSLDTGRWLDGGDLSLPMDEVFRKRWGSEWRGSDLARDPVTGHYLLIAGLNRAAAELAPEGRLTAVGPLGRHHPQAEGVAVAPDGTILVSDEGGKGPGHLTVYSCAR